MDNISSNIARCQLVSHSPSANIGDSFALISSGLSSSRQLAKLGAPTSPEKTDLADVELSTKVLMLLGGHANSSGGVPCRPIAGTVVKVNAPLLVETALRQ